MVGPIKDKRVLDLDLQHQLLQLDQQQNKWEYVLTHCSSYLLVSLIALLFMLASEAS